MTDFTRYLSTLLGITVIDQTGFTGPFDAQLSFTPDEALALIRGTGPAPRPEDAAAGTIFPALQEQLGLKLEATMAPVEVLVIDHVERPAPNSGGGI